MSLTKFERYRLLMESRAVVILRSVPPDQVRPVVEALLDGGVTALEVTLNSDDAIGQIRMAVEAAQGRALVGAGTVLDEAAATAAILAGANFLVAPSLSEAVIRTAHRYGRLAIPGAMTPTEIVAAAEAGADIIKVFPASSLGARYFKEIRGPLREYTLMATGGVSAANAADFLSAGASLLGVGGAVVDTGLIADGRYDEIRSRAAELVAKVKCIVTR